MIKKEKIFELKIEEDDDVSGIDSISLVDEPAIEVNWVAFNKTKEDFYIPDGEDEKYLDLIMSKSEAEDDLINDGWEVASVRVLGEEKFYNTEPNQPSAQDTEDYLVRYKYILNPNISQAAVISTTRQFCKTILNQNRVWRIEDMDAVFNEFGQPATMWRGGYNCRHRWAEIKYKRDAKIINKASVKTGIESESIPQQPTTYTEKTINNPSPSTVRNLGLKKELEEEDMGYDVGTIGGYVDPGVKKKKKKKLEEDDEVISKSLAPATTFEYLTPKQQMSKQYFAIDNEEKRIVLGPAMIPDMKIFRKDALGNPYYVFFSEDTIRMIADKYMRNKYTDNNDQMHDGKAVKDVYVVESWIKEDQEDKSTKYGYGELPVGTWFVSMKVKNDEIWNKVKEGQLNGFSVSGFFEEVAAFSKEEMFLYQVVEILKKY